MPKSKKPESAEESVEEIIAPAQEDLRNSFTDPLETIAFIVRKLKVPFDDWTKKELPPIDPSYGFSEEGKTPKSRKLVTLIRAEATSNNRHIIVVRFREAPLRQIVEAIAGVLPHAVTGTKHDAEYAEVHRNFGLGDRLRQPTPNVHLSKKIDSIVEAIGEFPQRWVKYEALTTSRKASMTDGKDPQTGRQLKVTCRTCEVKPGTKGLILRQSLGSIQAYGIARCWHPDHGDMIVELKKKDKPLPEGVPFYVKDAEPEVAPAAESEASEASPTPESDDTDAPVPVEAQDNAVTEHLDAAE